MKEDIKNCSLGSIANLIKKFYSLPYDFVKIYAACIVNMLEFLHNEQQIVHHNLKPENLIIDKDAMYIFVDYEKVKQIDPDDISPQAFDLYALGCMIYEMLVGHVPFRKAPKKVEEE